MNRRPLLLVLSGTLLIGCGGSIDGSADGAFTTRVSGNIRLNSLSSAQATQLCDDVNTANTATLQPTRCARDDHSNAVLATSAYLQDNPTATDADLQADCSQLLAANEAGDCYGVASCDATTINTNSPYCEATVTDIVKCINENDAITKNLLAATPACDAVTVSSVSAYGAPGGPYGTYNVVSMSASCDALSHCNGIFTLSTPPPGS